jgi:ketosteroid isomerase-like protein
MVDAATTEQEIRDIERAFAQAMKQRDIAFLDRLLSDEVIFTNFQGNLTSKAQDLAPFESGDLAITTYEAEDLMIRSYGSTAIANLGLKIEGTFRNEAFSGRYRYTRIYLKQNEQWQVIAAHATEIAQ